MEIELCKLRLTMHPAAGQKAKRVVLVLAAHPVAIPQAIEPPVKHPIQSLPLSLPFIWKYGAHANARYGCAAAKWAPYRWRAPPMS